MFYDKLFSSLDFTLPRAATGMFNILLQANPLSQTARSVVKQTGCFVGRSRAAVSGGRCVLSPPDCFVA